MKNFESAKLELTYLSVETNKETRITLNGLIENPDTDKVNALALALSNLIEDAFTGAEAVERYTVA